MTAGLRRLKPEAAEFEAESPKISTERGVDLPNAFAGVAVTVEIVRPVFVGVGCSSPSQLVAVAISANVETPLVWMRWSQLLPDKAKVRAYVGERLIIVGDLLLGSGFASKLNRRGGWVPRSSAALLRKLYFEAAGEATERMVHSREDKKSPLSSKRSRYDIFW